MDDREIVNLIKETLRDVTLFTRLGGITLREYQRQAARTIVQAVLSRSGRSLVVLFPRQSGKNELQAQVEAFFLLLLSNKNSELVKISPTHKPQSLNAMRRLERVLQANPLTNGRWIKESGYIYRLGKARILFFSGAPEASIVGATATHLLEVDEAQDVSIEKYDKDIAPMAAAGNASRIFWGTAWTPRTLLAREIRISRQAENRDGGRRVFTVTADDVGRELPSYRAYVQEQIERLGRQHPLVRTQYFCEEIDAEGGLFNLQRQVLMNGDHLPRRTPLGGAVYAFLLDVAGEDENGGMENILSMGERRDATALTIVQADPQDTQDEKPSLPVYRVMQRMQWVGIKHSNLFDRLGGLMDLWKPRFLVVDATGVGAGLVSFLEKKYGRRVIPFVFSSASKSKLGWQFLGLVDSGRFKDHCRMDEADLLQEEFYRQLNACQYRVREGPNHLLEWGTPDGARDPLTGCWQHDDLIISAALTAILDDQPWYSPSGALLVRSGDILHSLDSEGY